MTSVPGAGAVDDAVRAEQHGLDVRRVRDADDDDVGGRDGLGRRSRPCRRRDRRARRRGPGVRFQAVTVNPARARLAAIAAPIVPRPRNATGVSVMTSVGLGGMPAGPAGAAGGAAVGRGGSTASGLPRPRAMRKTAASTDDCDQDDDPEQVLSSATRPGAGAAALGRRARGGARARARATTGVTTIWTPLFGLSVGDDRDARHVAPGLALAADLGCDDVVLVRLDVRDRVRDGRRPPGGPLGDVPDVDAQRLAGRWVDRGW